MRPAGGGSLGVEPSLMGGVSSTTALIAAILSASPAASPSALPVAPGPTAAPMDGALKEIAHVRVTTPFCKTALEETTAGVEIVMANDQRIADTARTLRTADFDYSDLGKKNAVIQLSAQFVALKAAATEGNRTMAELTALTKDAPTPDQQRALLAFGEALDGALMRQKRLGDVIARMTVVLDNMPRVDEFQENANEMAAIESQNYAFAYKDPQGPLAHLPPTLKAIASSDADVLEYRATPIQRDEDTAAERIDAAFSAC